MSDDAKLVMAVMLVVIVVIFLTALLIAAWANHEKDLDLARRDQVNELAQEAMIKKITGSRYAIDVRFFDREESKLHYENVCAHFIKGDVLTIIFPARYVVYVPVSIVKRIKVMPMADRDGGVTYHVD